MPRSSDASDHCKICGGVGYLRQELPVTHPDFGQLTPCKCRAQDIANRVQNVTGTPLLEDATFDKMITYERPSTAKMVNALDGWDGIGTITVWGNNGNGKSTALMACINQLLDRQIAAVYMTATDLMEHVKDGITKPHSDSDRLRKLSQIRVLALDELSQVRWTDYVTQSLEHLINLRYTYGYRADVGTLIALDEPLDVLPNRIVSRLREDTVVHNNDSDIRPILSSL